MLLLYESTSKAISFTLKVLDLCKNMKRFYLTQGDVWKCEMKKYTLRNTDVCDIFVGWIS